MAQKVRAREIAGEAITFSVAKFGASLRIGWFPLLLGLVLATAVYAYFFAPYWPEIMMWFQEAWATAESSDAKTEKLPGGIEDPLDDPFVQAMMDMGSGQVSALYSLSFLISLLSMAIPSVAYARMAAGEAAPRGFFYLRLGGKEIAVTISYFVMLIGFYLCLLVALLVALVPLLAVMGFQSLDQGTTPDLGFVLGFSTFFLMAMFLAVALPWSKLGMAVPVAANEGGIGIGEAWDRSAGHLWMMIRAIFLICVALVVANIVFVVIFILLAIPFGIGIAYLPEEHYFVAIVALAAVFYLLYYLVSYAYTLALSTAMMTFAADRLNSGPRADDVGNQAEANE